MRTPDVLVFEPDAHQQGVIARVLREEGHQPAFARGGADLLAGSEAGRPWLVILNAVLPDMQCGELVQRMRPMPGMPPSVIVLLPDAASVEAIGTCGDIFVFKPASAQELRAFIRHLWLEQHNSGE